jgi:hypothetical protein
MDYYILFTMLYTLETCFITRECMGKNDQRSGAETDKGTERLER